MNSGYNSLSSREASWWNLNLKNFTIDSTNKIQKTWNLHNVLLNENFIHFFSFGFWKFNFDQIQQSRLLCCTNAFCASQWMRWEKQKSAVLYRDIYGTLSKIKFDRIRAVPSFSDVSWRFHKITWRTGIYTHVYIQCKEEYCVWADDSILSCIFAVPVNQIEYSSVEARKEKKEKEKREKLEEKEKEKEREGEGKHYPLSNKRVTHINATVTYASLLILIYIQLEKRLESRIALICVALRILYMLKLLKTKLYVLSYMKSLSIAMTLWQDKKLAPFRRLLLARLVLLPKKLFNLYIKLYVLRRP